MSGRTRQHIEPSPGSRRSCSRGCNAANLSRSDPVGSADSSYSWEPEHRFSRLLRCEHGQIIGWLITHSAGIDLLRYGKLWIDPG